MGGEEEGREGTEEGSVLVAGVVDGIGEREEEGGGERRREEERSNGEEGSVLIAGAVDGSA